MKKDLDFDVIVIGGGVVGLACAYKICRRYSGVSVAVLEKEDRLATHQSGRNSGVIHSGLYYKAGSKKAANCARGRSELLSFAKEHKIAYRLSGKIVVATDRTELGRLESLYQNAQANKIDGVEMIGPDEIEQIEPFCLGLAAIHVPYAGTIDFVMVTETLGRLVEAQADRNKILTSHEVIGFDKHDFYTKVITDKATFIAKCVVNCAGLWSDRIARLDMFEPKLKIVPFRGDYFRLSQAAGQKVRGLIYPVPDPQLPFLGVHFTRMIDGSVECGPSAVFSFKREGYSKSSFSLADTWDALSYRGTWRLFARCWVYGLKEYGRVFSKRLVLRQLRKLVPSLQLEDLEPAPCGVRAQAVGIRGELIDDFVVEKVGNSVHVLNAPSPAATASLAIGDYVSGLLADIL